VTVAVVRIVGGERASVQLWLGDCKLLQAKGSKRPIRPVEWGRQMSRRRVFDALVGDIDRNAGNGVAEEWGEFAVFSE
jgi:hypothetical protein